MSNNKSYAVEQIMRENPITKSIEVFQIESDDMDGLYYYPSEWEENLPKFVVEYKDGKEITFFKCIQITKNNKKDGNNE